MMRPLKILLVIPFLALALSARAETIHLMDGETIKGKIISTDEQSISLESDKGFGVIQIPRKEIVLIEFDNTGRDLSNTLGLGYYHRSAPLSGSGSANDYGVDSFSIKYWLNGYNSLDVLVGFYDSSSGSTTLLKVFTLDLRYANVFERKAGMDLYYGGSAGYLNVEDNTSGASLASTGTSVRLFLGVELFFVTLPNLGISAEVGMGTQTVGNVSTTNISASTFPTFSMRYYF